MTQSDIAARPRTERTLWANRAGFGLAMATNSVFFLTLVMTRLLIAKGEVPATVQPLTGLVLTVVMVGSALVGRAAVAAIRDDRMPQARQRLLVTAVLGTLVIVGGAVVWATFPVPPTNLDVPASLVVHYGPTAYPATTVVPHASGLYGQIFFTLTGLVAIESLVGLGALWSHWLPARFARLSPGNHWGLESSVLFWEFLALMWVVAYVVLYLI